MNKIKSLILSFIAAVAIVGTAFAAVPWNPVDIQNVTGATPSPTAFATQAAGGSVLIDLMTGNTTMGALTGGVTGQYYTIVIMQDGTGGRTFTGPTGLTGMPAVPTAANAYTVCVTKKTGTSTFAVQACYDNLDLQGIASYNQATAGAAIALNAFAQGATIVAPGMTVQKGCIANPQTFPATWQVGIYTICEPLTNAMIVDVVNPTAATRTPAAVTVTVTQLTKPQQ